MVYVKIYHFTSTYFSLTMLYLYLVQLPWPCKLSNTHKEQITIYTKKQTNTMCTIDNSCVVSSFSRNFSGTFVFALWPNSTPLPAAPRVDVPGFCDGRLILDLMSGSRLSSRWRSRDTVGGFSGMEGWTPSIANQWAVNQITSETNIA